VNPLDAVKSIKRPSLKRPSFIKRPSFKRPSVNLPSFSIPSPWLVGAVLLVAVWIGWAIYTAADRGFNAGLGVLVAWPTLLLLAAIAIAPLAGIAYVIVRLVRRQRLATESGPDDDDESITSRTFPL
jgi:hypothetical protein